ncbi:hypothetical protein [uncultured Gammaproteobacteria bacterium]|nr:hypothetical protein [uncultured Gammaproteobacteria bacterium]
MIAAIPRFIQLGMPLPPLKPMGQLRRGVAVMRMTLLKLTKTLCLNLSLHLIKYYRPMLT